MAKRERLRAVRQERPLTWDEVWKRNSVERIKRERAPYDVIVDVPQLAETPYEAIDEDDILRLQWWGLYHDKPKTGQFMMRVKLAGGVVTPRQLDAIGRVSRDFGENTGEITTRQDVQIHRIGLPNLPAIFARLKEAGLTTAGACGDILRNITSCPVAGIDQNEVFDVTPVLHDLAAFFYGNRDYSDLPRKHKWTVSACPHHCNAPEIHDAGLIGVVQDGVAGFAVLVGGGLSTAPRIAQSLGVFVPAEAARETLRALLDVWSSDLTYRRSRGKARFKFMVDDLGPDGVRQRIEERLGRPLLPLKTYPLPTGRADHMGVHPQKQAGLHYIGFPVFLGLLTGEQMIQIAALVAQKGRDVRFTREQNLIISGVKTQDVDAVIRAMEAIGVPLDVNRLRANSIGCTGNPYCNFAVGDTKPRLGQLIQRLEDRFGQATSDVRIHLDGCPHACGQHFVGDIGIQGTTRRDETGKVQAYDIFLRGGLGEDAEIGRPLARRVPWDQLNDYVERLVAWYLAERRDGETFPAACRRLSDEALAAIMAGEVEEGAVG